MQRFSAALEHGLKGGTTQDLLGKKWTREYYLLRPVRSDLRKTDSVTTPYEGTMEIDLGVSDTEDGKPVRGSNAAVYLQVVVHPKGDKWVVQPTKRPDIAYDIMQEVTEAFRAAGAEGSFNFFNGQ